MKGRQNKKNASPPVECPQQTTTLRLPAHSLRRTSRTSYSRSAVTPEDSRNMTSAEEPLAKKTKLADGEAAAPAVTGWEGHAMNIAEAVMVADEGDSFAKLAGKPVSTLQGLSDRGERLLEEFDIETVADLANFKFYLVAKALVTLAPMEREGKRPAGSVMNIDKAVTSEYEAKSLADIVESPVAALEGISAKGAALLEELDVKTVGKLGSWKFAEWAAAIVALQEFEHLKTAAERKQEAMLKRLE